MRTKTDRPLDWTPTTSPHAVLYGCLLLFLMGWGACALAYSTPTHDAHARLLWLIAGCTSLFGSVFFWVLHTSRTLQTPSSQHLRQTTLELKETFGDLDTLRNEQRKLRKMLTEQMEDLQARIHQEFQLLESFHKSIEDRYKLLDQKEQQIRQARTQQEMLQKRIEHWQNMAEDFMDALERSFSHLTSEQEYNCLSRITRAFASLCHPHGVELIQPQIGDIFVSQEHEWAGEAYHPTIPKGNILRCEAWGRRTPAQTKRARVVLSLGSQPIPTHYPQPEPSELFSQEDTQTTYSSEPDFCEEIDLKKEIFPPDFSEIHEKE